MEALMARDLSGGLPVEREQIRTTPPDVPFWSENLLFAVYDPTSDVGLWLHLGTVPTDWEMWHEFCYAYLPGDRGVLSMWSYHRTAPERRPGGANSEFRCIEPFRRWHLSLDGFGVPTSNEEMAAGLTRPTGMPVSLSERFVVDLDIEFVTPVFDAHTAAMSEGGGGSMHAQSWAKEHYQQLYRARGTVVLGKDEIPFDGYGWRDHSTGPRGGGDPEAMKNIGGSGHLIMGTLFPESGRGWGLARFWSSGVITLDGGWVATEDGVLHYAEVLEAPRMRELTMKPEELSVALRWPGGLLETSVTTRRSLWVSMMRGLAVGKDLDGPGFMYALNHGPSEWDGEVGHAYVDRSETLNAFAEVLRRG
jgi:hypothetical protein